MTEPDFVDELITEGGEDFQRLVDEAFMRRHKIREQLKNLGLTPGVWKKKTTEEES